MSLFTPSYMTPRITDLEPQQLADRGIVGLLLDVDNTLTTFHSQHVPDDIQAWLARAREAGLQPMVVSNAVGSRVEPFAKRLGVRWIDTACKPLPFGFWRACRALHLKRRQCLVIGDQTFTDVLGAKLADIRCVETDPIQREDGHPTLLFKRRLEVGIRRRAQRTLARRRQQRKEFL